MSEMEDIFGDQAIHLQLPLKAVDDRLKRLQHWDREIQETETRHLPKEIEGQIEYFKSLKPEFTRMLHYYGRVYQYELHEPPRKVKYYTKALKSHEKDYYRIEDWFVYVRSGDSSKDEQHFSATSDSKDMVGVVHASSMVTDYLFNKIGLQPISHDPVVTTQKVQWHFNQNDIAEMAKGFKVTGLATGNLQDIADELASAFNVKVNNLYIKLHVISQRQNVSRLFDQVSKQLKKSDK